MYFIVHTGRGCVDIFLLSLSPNVLGTARCRLKYSVKVPLNFVNQFSRYYPKMHQTLRLHEDYLRRPTPIFSEIPVLENFPHCIIQ